MTDRRRKAEAIVERSAVWALACGLVPVPAIDVAALTLVEIGMLEQLAQLYERPFSRVRAEAYVASLLGSYASAQIGLVYLKAGLSVIPVVGTLLGAASMSVTGASITYAIGRLFIVDFEAGRAVSGFDPDFAQHRLLEAPPSVVVEAAEPPRPAAPPPVETEPEGAGAAAVGPKDDLTLVIGIGPKIAELLATKGISTFAELAATSVDSLKAILHDAGTRYAWHDPATWPDQAKLVLEGKIDQLSSFVSEASQAQGDQ